MLRKLHLLILSAILPLVVMAQNQKNNWYFGRGAAMEFSSGQVQILNTNKLTDYNYASVTANNSSTGNLLFYSNGFDLVNANHNVVANISGNETNFDLLAIENPNTPNEWYLFTLSGTAGPTGISNLSYYKIETNSDGTSVKVLGSKKNMYKGNLQKLTAVKNCTNGGYWVVSYNSTKNAILAFNLDGKGLNPTPIVSSFSHNIDFAGDLVSDHNGNKLAISEFYHDEDGAQVVTLNVNKQCGTFTQDLVLDFLNAENAYGLAFSPNNKYLYATYSVGFSRLVQYNVSTGAFDLIWQEAYNFNELQSAPDGKIYIATHTVGAPGSRIDVINNPNEFGAACKYEYGALDLGNSKTSNFHFPNFIQDFTEEKCPIDSPIFDISSTCFGKPIDINFKANHVLYDSFYWDLNGKLYADIEPKINGLDTGVYLLQFIWKYCNDFDTVKQEFRITEAFNFGLGLDTSICIGDSITIGHKLQNNASYWWDFKNKSTSHISVADTGNYCLTINNNGCKSTACKRVSFYSEIWTTLGEEYFLCPYDNELVKLDAGKGFNNYLWYPTGDSSQWIEVADLGSYFVIVTDFRGCSASDSSKVKRLCNASLFFPNAFSPNNDGINDTFGAIGEDLIAYNLQIYNKWGERIFESFDINHKWDGTFKNKKCPTDQYLYKCTYTGLNKKRGKDQFFTTGKVVLLR